MAGRRLYLRFARTRTEGIVDLYKENAPVTCETIWNALATPIRVTVFHAMFAGPDSEKSQRAMKAMRQMKKIDIDGLKRAYAG